MSPSVGKRRRGEVLELAILDAAWEELSELGYADLTLDSVAARAGTSRPVLSRRWRDRANLVVAAVDHYRARHPVVVEDVGDLRLELASLLRQLSDRGAPTVEVVMFGLEGFFDQTKSNFEDLRRKLRCPTVLDEIFQRAVRRGELDAKRLTARIAALPIDLVRHETYQTRKPVSKAAIFEIIDSIFLPLVRPVERPKKSASPKKSPAR